MGFNSGFKGLKAELNPICHLLALLGSHRILHVSRIRVNVTLRFMVLRAHPEKEVVGSAFKFGIAKYKIVNWPPWILNSWFRASWFNVNKKVQLDATVLCRHLFTAVTLHVSGFTAPIIRSTKICICYLRYKSWYWYRYFLQPWPDRDWYWT